MAIFHLNEKNISRSDGRSAVACAAYRACEKLEDHTYGKIQDYTKKKGLEYKNIYAPEHTSEKLLDRQILWNSVEKKEFNANDSMKENARLAKEYTCALPHELSTEQRAEIVDDFCRDFVKKHNVIVDACIHAPHDNNETDNKNYHVHIMFTTRLVNDRGELGKKQRTFNDKGPEILKDSRATFANVVNTALKNAGLDERVDHRSYADQGLDFLEPTAHEGHEVTALRRNGIDTEISLKNDAIKAKNLKAAREYQQIIKGLDQEIIVPSKLEDQIAELEKELSLTETEEQQLLAELANLDREEELLQEQLTQQIDNAYDNFIEQQSQYIDFAKRFYAKVRQTRLQLENLDKQLEKSEKWLSKQHGFYFSSGTFYDNYHHQRIEVSTPHFFTTQHKTEAKKEQVMKQYRKAVAQLFDDFDIEKTVSALKQSAKKLDENGIDLPTKKPTFMQRLKGEYVHSFDTLDDFATDMRPAFDDYKSELSDAEREKRKKLEEEKLARQVKQSMEEQKRKQDEEHALEMQRRNEASELLRHQRLAAQMQPQPEKRKNLENKNNNDCGPSI